MRRVSLNFLQPPGAKLPLTITSGHRENVTSH